MALDFDLDVAGADRDVLGDHREQLALGDDEIERYLLAERPYDCAGSAKAEALGIALLQSVESDDPTALIGLPLIRTCELLRRAGLDPLNPGPP